MTTAPSQETAASRISALDGLRGVTIVLVVVGHAGNLLWPLDTVNTVPFLRGFFGGGAVGVFFVVGGYIVTRGLLRSLEQDTFDAVRFYLRRLVRLGVQVVPLALAVLLIHAFDPTDPYSTRATVESALNVVTHTTNLHASTDLLNIRADLGHMWYLAVQQQVYLVLPFVLLLLARRRLVLGLALAELVVASILWRHHVLEASGWIDATISTLARADTVLTGALVAVAVAAVARWRHLAPTALALGAAGLVGLMAVLQELGDFAYLRTWGVLYTLAAGITVLAIALLDRPTRVSRLLSVAPLTWLGRASLAIFVWHLPLFMLVERHTKSWTWQPRAITALALLAAIVWVTHRALDEPARLWLRTHLRAPAPLPHANPRAERTDDRHDDRPAQQVGTAGPGGTP